MPQLTNLILFGDSSIDNYHWVKKGETLEEKLKLKLGEAQVHNLAVDGFTTTNVLNGGSRGKAVRDDKHQPGHYNPFNELKKVENPTHILVSVGGNNVREYLQSLIMATPKQREASLARILTEIKDDYIQIIDKLKEEKPGAKPIIMLQYTPLLAQDIYSIYYLMDILRHNKTIEKNLSSAFDYGLYKLFGFIRESSQINAVKKLHEIMATVYQPILKYAKEQNIPVIDLASTLDYNDKDFYQCQIEPSNQGSSAIADVVMHVIENHDFTSESKTYSRPGCNTGDILEMPTSEKWQPHRAPDNKNDAKQLFLETYQKALARDKHRFFGLKSYFACSRVEGKSIDELIKHAKGESKKGSGERSFKVMRALGWLNEDKTINKDSGVNEMLSSSQP
jgi:hypothetical protein